MKIDNFQELDCYLFWFFSDFFQFYDNKLVQIMKITLQINSSCQNYTEKWYHLSLHDV